LLCKSLISETDKLTRIASSTASDLILKDIIQATDTDQMLEGAGILTKQFVSALIFFHRPGAHCVSLTGAFQPIEDAADTKWMNLLCQRN
jgi:hypothetical protein